MKIIEKISELQEFLKVCRKKGKTIGFVPTMGFLHEGHSSLVNKSKKENDITIVSIYVNPSQFGVGEDLDKYPRDLERDIKILEKDKVDVVFLPLREEISNPNLKLFKKYKDIIYLKNPSKEFLRLNKILCGAKRPGHFEGVFEIVSKFFLLIKPDRAYFGQKDFQQFKIIEIIKKELNLSIKSVMCSIVREKAGLAKSSRNVYLNKFDRKKALILYNSLCGIKNNIEYTFDSKDSSPAYGVRRREEILLKYRNNFLKFKNIKLEYLEIRDAKNLKNIRKYKENRTYIVLGAMKIGNVRLIDNVVAK
ncbi:pantoate--beta-alanine ligase [Candidatus Peregrinibacteria bacterium RIFOXYA2_FULL_33_7]|nr:MAG: pantoate--beta-alanine ligase [Candidatus Peregrinibacteria bacterium RIFOXYA2_FULL_33_7]